MTQHLAVIGATGFVGSAVVQAMQRHGHEVLQIRAPRLDGGAPDDAAGLLQAREMDVDALTNQFSGLDAVVNCAGDPDASSRNKEALNRSNGELVAVIADAVRRSGVPRFVHISSAVVQGRRPMLDESFTYDAFSTYARSKVRGELLLRSVLPVGSVIYRPPSVHAAGRRVTRLTTRIARSPFASVAAPGDSPAPQALLPNVADAIRFLATCPQTPPPVVIHPWEGVTTEGLMQTLGKRDPHVLPRMPARALVLAATMAGRVIPRVAANARRLEMLWFGQQQATSWLTDQGWEPPYSWSDLGDPV